MFRILGIFTFLITAMTAFAAGPSLNLKDFSSSMSLTRYETQDFNTITRSFYDPVEGQYFPKRRELRFELPSKSCFAQYLLGQQDFPLATMLKRLGYTPEIVDEQKLIGVSAQHDQVVFLEKTRLVPEELWKGSRDDTAIDTISDQAAPSGKVRVKTAALWTVAGQTLSHEEPFIIPQKLPWQREPGLDKLAEKYLDRTKYKYVSEWGRAAQVMPGEIDSLYSSAAATDYQRVRAMGGKIEDAWVMVETSRKQNIRLYDSEDFFKGYRFPPHPDAEDLAANDKSVVYLIPLAEMMKKFPPGEHLRRVAEIKKLSGKELSDADALDILSQYKLASLDELNFISSSGIDQNQPLLIRDLSSASYEGLYESFKRLGIERSQWLPMSRYLSKNMRTVETFNVGQYRDSGGVSFMEALKKLNAVEISNLNGELANADPEFVKSALLSSFLFYVQKYHGGRPTPEQSELLSSQMRQVGVHFVLTTRDPTIAEQALKIHPLHIFHHPIYFKVRGEDRVSLGSTFVFSIRQIEDMLNHANLNWFDYYTKAVQPGSRRAHYLLNSNDSIF